MNRKILFCTVDSWNVNSSTVSSNTYISLFDDYPRDNKAALFIREEFADSMCCARYFQISEQRIIKSVFHRNYRTGREINPGESPTIQDIQEIQNKEKLYRSNRGRKAIMLFFRELIWKLGKWRTDELDVFLDDYAPDVIIFSFEGYIHFNRLCRYVVKKTGAKAIGYIWDDTFTYKSVPKRIGLKIYRFFQRRSLLRTARYCNAFWAISPKTKEEADQFFGINSIVVTKPILSLNEGYKLTISPIIRIVYTGNLAIGRFDTLTMLSDSIRRINSPRKVFVVDVYTSTYLDFAQKGRLCEDIHIHKPVPPADVIQLQRCADVLLFLEGLENYNKAIARLSFSTKITDYLSAGRCILALGPNDIAPMEYLKNEKAALCASTRDEIDGILLAISKDRELLVEYSNNALACGKRHHLKEDIKTRVMDSINNL